MLEEFPLPIDESPFVSVLNGTAPGTIIVRDDTAKFAIIESVQPEAAIHWLAIPFEPIPSIEELETHNRARFLDLLNFAINQTKALTDKYENLGNGFTIKFHLGAFETIPHAKLHILSCE
ncbi:MAG: hypothetical protein R3E31_15565 [Chloroflexota bacterium]|nr:hypothetical protein [Anaerolineales bacterium]MCB8966108.1 hypothetical protein [Ardenticatenaceae bacterium]